MSSGLHPGIAAAALIALLLGACSAGSRLGLSDKPETKAQPEVDLTRDNTPANRATQVAWTSARAQYCAFNMRSDKLKADYLAYEGRQGLSLEEMTKITRVYDLTYNTFYTQVREIPTYCTRERIEEIRPDINRHLAGDYTPTQRKPPTPEVTPDAVQDSLERPNDDPAQHYER